MSQDNGLKSEFRRSSTATEVAWIPRAEASELLNEDGFLPEGIHETSLEKVRELLAASEQQIGVPRFSPSCPNS